MIRSLLSPCASVELIKYEYGHHYDYDDEYGHWH